MAKGKRFYKKNTNAVEQNGVAGGDTVNKNYEARSNGGQGGKPGPAGKPGGKPPRKFRKNDWNGSKEQNTGRSEGNAAKRGDNANRINNRPPRPGVENRKPQMAGRLLVAYYSWSGVTDKAARKIASVVKGNTYRILPVKAYPSMYGLCVAKAGMEKASGARPELKGTLPDCSRYEKIAIGFPIWWFSCPNIIHSFLEKVNLDGKKVYPFCTSKTSGPRGSADAIRSTVPKADVKDCLDANKLDSMTDEDIKKWLEM